jgi:inner membrane transporter RhtA
MDLTAESQAQAHRLTGRLPAPALFGVSAVFHYFGPALAVLLFAHLEVLGVAWLRIATAAAVFAVWRRPWRPVKCIPAGQRWVLLALGTVLAAMNIVFYLAVARLPLSTVGAIEFLGIIALAALGVRTPRNALALGIAGCGVLTLTDVRFAGEPLGFGFAFANCALFTLYVILGHRIANAGPSDSPAWSGVDQLGAAMLIAAVVATPLGFTDAIRAFAHPGWLLSGIAVGVSSSVVPYVIDQFVMARLPRASFALMLTILPASATVIGMVMLAQFPTTPELAGIGLVIAGIAVHQPSPEVPPSRKETT